MNTHFDLRLLYQGGINEARARIKEAAKSNTQLTAFCLNVHTLRLLYTSKKLASVFMVADMLFPDGVPVLWMKKIRRIQSGGRVSGTHLTELLLKDPSFTIFILGSTSHIIDSIQEKYCINGQSKIVGSFSEWVEEKDYVRVIDTLQESVSFSKSNIVIAALSQPKQELLLHALRNSFDSKVFIGVGSALDILSGKSPRAPIFLQQLSLEWLWRVIIEPRRLLLRYIADINYFSRWGIDEIKTRVFNNRYIP